MSQSTLVAVTSGVLLTLAIVGGALALDRTTLHWYSDEEVPTPTSTNTPRPTNTPLPTSTPSPNYSYVDVVRLTQTEIAKRPFPSGTQYVICFEAEYRSQNETWVVTCQYFVNSVGTAADVLINDIEAEATQTFLFDDRTGVLR